ncbi:MAG: ABC transporter substrate-binding protein [Pseudomonadota bacterium]|jgi:NitT/TauT family transport system substrate-binding protein|nr:ABC transporter substrate-binding protein [Pseudomonadota bacterium]
MRRFLMLMVITLLASSGRSFADSALEIGYMPIIPVSQAFVMLEGDVLSRAGVSAPALIEFQNGPAIVQALLAGQLDVAYLGIGPAMVARAKGADIKVVASNIIEQIGLIALGDLAPYFTKGDARTAFARFRKDHGRKAVITTFPQGSVPETVLQYWLRNRLGLGAQEIAQDLEIIYQGTAQVQQSLMTGAVDGAAILEPIISIVLERKPEARVVAAGSEMFPHQPGAVLVVRERLIDERPELVMALVRAHVEATELLRNQPARAASAVGKYVGGGRLPQDIVRQALERSKQQFQADPGAIIEGTQIMRDFQTELGTLQVEVDLDALFDTRFYDELGLE